MSEPSPGVGGSSDGLQTVKNTAAAWHARLRADTAGLKEQTAFEDWVAADPTHRSAFEAVERAWSATAEVAEHEAVRAIRAQVLASAARRRMPLPYWASAAVVLLAVGLVWGFFSLYAAHQRDIGALYSTVVGAHTAVPLADGSTVILNTDSQVRIEYGKEERAISLLHGQALFQVARDSNRPFVVRAADRRIKALGTSFDVQLVGASVKVTLVDGRVAVEKVGAESSRLRLELAPGQQLIAAVSGEDRVSRTDVSQVTSWQEGKLILEDEPLGQAVSEVNRYSERKIVVGDAALDDLRVSGVFRTGSPDSFAKALSDYFPVNAEERKGQLVLTARVPSKGR